MMVASIIKLQNHFPHMPPILATFLPIFFVIILAILVAKYVEPFVKSIICVIANLIYRQKSVAA
jgi:hypothetical protein